MYFFPLPHAQGSLRPTFRPAKTVLVDCEFGRSASCVHWMGGPGVAWIWLIPNSSSTCSKSPSTISSTESLWKAFRITLMDSTALQVQEMTDDKPIQTWVVLFAFPELVSQDSNSPFPILSRGFPNVGDGLYRAKFRIKPMSVVLQVCRQGRDGRSPDHGHNLWKLFLDPIVILLVDSLKLPNQDIYCLNGSELTQRPPRMQGCPHLRALRIGLVQIIVGEHAHQVGNMLVGNAEFEIIRPLPHGPGIADAEKLPDRIGIGSCLHRLRFIGSKPNDQLRRTDSALRSQSHELGSPQPSSPL